MQIVVTLSDVIGMGLWVVMALVIAIWAMKDWWRQYSCNHERYYENRACHAICQHCGKDLGFIGTVREQREKELEHGSKS